MKLSKLRRTNRDGSQSVAIRQSLVSAQSIQYSQLLPCRIRRPRFPKLSTSRCSNISARLTVFINQCSKHTFAGHAEKNFIFAQTISSFWKWYTRGSSCLPDALWAFLSADLLLCCFDRPCAGHYCFPLPVLELPPCFGRLAGILIISFIILEI